MNRFQILIRILFRPGHRFRAGLDQNQLFATATLRLLYLARRMVRAFYNLHRHMALWTLKNISAPHLHRLNFLKKTAPEDCAVLERKAGVMAGSGAPIKLLKAILQVLAGPVKKGAIQVPYMPRLPFCAFHWEDPLPQR